MTLVSSGSLPAHDACKIAYEHYTAGHQKAVILAHGYFKSTDETLFKNIKESLLDTYDVIIFNFPARNKKDIDRSDVSSQKQDLEVITNYARRKYPLVGLVKYHCDALIVDELKGMNSIVSINTPTKQTLNKLSDSKEQQGEFILKRTNTTLSPVSGLCPILYIYGGRSAKDALDKKKNIRLSQTSRTAIKQKRAGIGDFEKKNKRETVQVIKEWFHKTISAERRVSDPSLKLLAGD